MNRLPRILPLVGVAVGLGGGLLVTISTRRGWASPSYRGIGALALALLAYALAIELGGNGFIGAFVLIGVQYPLYATLKGELVSADNRVSLWTGLKYQLTRPGSGSIFHFR